MKANKLMVGDWAKHSLYGNVQVRAIPNADQIYEPIPLTLEILEKNGFKQDDSFFENVADGYSCEFLIWHYYAEDIIISYDASEELSITYNMGHPCNEITLYRPNVHELQHALRLCGLNEMADNFKI